MKKKDCWKKCSRDGPKLRIECFPCLEKQLDAALKEVERLKKEGAENYEAGREAGVEDGYDRGCDASSAEFEIVIAEATAEIERLRKQTNDPILGQEAICPDGLGRVVEFNLIRPNKWIRIETYINDRSCSWDIDNVELINPKTK